MPSSKGDGTPYSLLYSQMEKENKSNFIVENLTNTTSVSKGSINSDKSCSQSVLLMWCDKSCTLCSSPKFKIPIHKWEKCQTFPNEGYSKIYLPGTFQDYQHHQREYRKSVTAKENLRRHDISKSCDYLDGILEYRKDKAKKIKEGRNYGIN